MICLDTFVALLFVAYVQTQFGTKTNGGRLSVVSKCACAYLLMVVPVELAVEILHAGVFVIEIGCQRWIFFYLKLYT